MANQWFYARNNQQAGPVAWEQLQQLASNGALAGSDLVWTQGMSNWAAATTVSGLFAPPPSPAVAAAPFAAPYPQQTPYGTPPPAPMGAPPYGGGQQQPAVPWLGYYAPSDLTHYAGFWIRFVAAFIDGIILLGVCAMLKTILGIHDPRGAFSPMDVLGTPGWWLQVALGFGYCASMESSVTQATLGKMAVGVKVTDALGNRLTFANALGRHAAKILSGLTLCVGYMMAGFTEKKRGLHDMIAGTLVVYK